MANEWLAQPAQPQARQCDSELRGRNSTASRCSVAWRAYLTRQPPVLAKGQSWLARTFTIANSAATKNPLAATKATTTKISKKPGMKQLVNLRAECLWCKPQEFCLRQELGAE